MEESKNRVRLCGTIAENAEFSHTSHGTEFYRFPLRITRLSGQADCINVLLSGEKLERIHADVGERLGIIGQLRSFNNKNGSGSRLVVSAFAQELEEENEEDRNIVELCGAICKVPTLRRTPLGRDICDIMLAVNRPYGRADYLPCIAWGVLAEQIGNMEIGEMLHIEGRIQSRQYMKVTDEGTRERTAYEVSVMHMAEPEEG